MQREKRAHIRKKKNSSESSTRAHIPHLLQQIKNMDEKITHVLIKICWRQNTFRKNIGETKKKKKLTVERKTPLLRT